ncbi:MAG: GH1 family beta-glucosidase [Pseudomonadota bacterium]
MKKLTIPAESFLASKAFILGVATSAYQIEGDINGRERCIWDTFCRQPATIKDGSNGDNACQHIKYWRHDVKLIADLGVDAYRFSIAWARVINADGSVNSAGLQFYIDLVDELTRYGIAAYATLYHWDLPQYLEDKGGWLNRQTAYHFADYAEVVGRALGNKVVSYATLNEPFCSAYLGYEAGIHAPGKQNRQYGRQVAHHLLLAHGLALPRLRQHAAKAQHGIVLNFSPCYAESDSSADARAAEMAHQYHNLWYLQPLLDGQYPEILQQLAQHERPQIAAGDMQIIQQPLDFLGVNYYTRTVFRMNASGWFSDVPARGSNLTSMGWEVFPQGLTEILSQLDDYFDHLPPVYITENGAAYDDAVHQGEVNDERRIDYFQTHLLAVDQALKAGVDIRGFFAWSLMDNFEWAEGYSQRFGLVHVNYETQQRTLKNSAKALQQLCLARQSQHLAVEDL